MRVFLMVAESGSFTGAARALGLSQPTVSQRVKALELRLGAQLIVRNGAAITLTETGALTRDHALTMERTAAAIERLTADHDRTNEGRVRLSTTDAVAAFWLAPRVVEFQRANPKIAISIDAGLWPSDHLREDVDLSLQYEENQNLDNVVIPVATVHYAVFASAEYLSLYGTPSSFAEMAAHRAILHSAQTRQRHSWDPSTAALQTLWAGQFETNSSAAVLNVARTGGGLALMPTAVATFAPELVMLGPGPAAKLRLWLVYHRDIARIGRVRRVIEWLRDVFDDAAQPWFREEFIHPRDFAAAAKLPTAPTQSALAIE